MNHSRIGIIGGSGLYDIEGFTKRQWKTVRTPFGSPSDQLLTGELGGRPVVFLPRHGRGHRILPGELNNRANIYAMKTLGVHWIEAVLVRIAACPINGSVGCHEHRRVLTPSAGYAPGRSHGGTRQGK